MIIESVGGVIILWPPVEGHFPNDMSKYSPQKKTQQQTKKMNPCLPSLVNQSIYCCHLQEKRWGAIHSTMNEGTLKEVGMTQSQLCHWKTTPCLAVDSCWAVFQSSLYNLQSFSNNYSARRILFIGSWTL